METHPALPVQGEEEGGGGGGPLRIEWHCFVSVSGFLAWLGWQNKEGFMRDKSALFHLMRNS